jgi:hypothetical protein
MSGFHFGKLPFDCPPTEIEVNGVSEGQVLAGSTLDVNLTDGTNQVTPDDVTLVGNTLTIEVKPKGAMPLKTGQQISYRTGDDGDEQQGREVDFFTLDYLNPFGTNERFTDTLGTQVYADGVYMNWSTWAKGKALGFYIGDTGTARNWNTAIDWAVALSVGAWTSGWRIPNVRQIQLLPDYEFGTGLLWLFPSLGGLSLWTSTTGPSSTAIAGALAVTTCNTTFSGKTNSFRTIACRIFTVTGTTLT